MTWTLKHVGIGGLFLLIGVMVLPFIARSADEAPATPPVAQVELFSPQGTVKGVRQVTARFTLPMVALGDPRLDDPFDIKCAVAGKGRWADTRNWVFDFDEDLPAGVQCSFTLKPNLTAIGRIAVSGIRTFSFATGGPAIVASFPREGWERIDEEQLFYLKLDAPATPQSIQENVHCVVEGIAELMPVEVLTGEARAAALKQRSALGYSYYQILWKNGSVSNAQVRNRTLEQAEQNVTVLRCQRRLPPATQMQLQWGAGVATASGIKTIQDQHLTFRVRPAFTAQVECTRSNARAGCMPMQPVRIQFSAPIPRELALAIRLKSSADKNEFKPQEKQLQNASTVDSVVFSGPFPENAPLTVTLPEQLVDDAGRKLQNAANFPLQLRVDEYPPLAKFSSDFGILEAREGGVLPVTLRNVEPQVAARQSSLPAKMLRVADNAAAIGEWLRRVQQAQESSGEWVDAAAVESTALKTRVEDQDEEENVDRANHRVWRETTGTHSVFKAQDVTTLFSVEKSKGPRPAEVIGIPLKKPGFYVVELESRRLGKSLLGRDESRYVSTTALVTDLVVHFKWGREASTVWVTRLHDGSPVPDAEIVVTNFCSGEPLWRGRTDRDGIASIGESFGQPHQSSRCYPRTPDPLLISAQVNGDFSFTQSGWMQGISPYDFGLQAGYAFNAQIYHTVFDRSLFRAGETVSMKHFLRLHQLNGIVTQRGLPAGRKIAIVHEGGQRYESQAAFSAEGVADQQWKIPAEAKLGTYVVYIMEGRAQHESGRFKVEQYRLPSMRASVTGPAQALIRPKEAVLDLHVAYMSGGGAAGLQVKVRSVVEKHPLQFAGYNDYQFGGSPVVEGIAEASRGYDFEAPQAEDDSTKARVMPITLDAQGSARITIPDLPQSEDPGQLTAELEYSDANGELLTTSGRVRLLPSELNVGIRREGWVASAEQLRFRVVVLDANGKPKAQQPVNVALYSSNYYSYRKRLIGGFYAYESTRVVTKLQTHCQGTTNAQGLVLCEVAPGVSGEILMRAETRDAQGYAAAATSSISVAGADDLWFGGTTGDRMDLLPEKKEYETGDIARFQVRMPFRSATALVTVEREGVMKSFVTQLSGKLPVVEVPIDDRFAPNVFVSVLVVRGRVSHVEPNSKGKRPAEEITALVDLNKPAYRLGVTEIKVGWKPHRLDVSVTPERKLYKVGEQAKVRVHVARANGSALPAGTEIALAAVDEALLELSPNRSWDLLQAMMGERGLEVWTSTAQMQVVGKRHYGRKAVPHGGGGGRDQERARELFDSLLLWKPKVVLDANGDATVSVPLNNSLSSFRIVAVAHGGTELFGTGSATVNTSQDLILLSGLPPLVREGDRFAATFTLRNTTDHPMTVELQATLTPAQTLNTQRVEISAGQARDIVWNVAAPVGSTQMRWDVSARASSSDARDKMHVDQTVIPAFPVRTYQATIAQLGEPVSMPAERPHGAIPGRGGIEITLREKLGEGLDGVREFMQRYPYICLEQQVSRAVSLRDKAYWDNWMARLPAYMDNDGLLKYFPTDLLDGDDSLTAYVLSIASEAGWEIPESSRGRMTNALRRFVNGNIVRRSALPTADLTIRKLAAIEALSRYGVAEPRMIDSIAVEPNLWPTSAVLDWLSILKRVNGIANAPQKRGAALGILRARLNFQGTTMGFSTERSDALWWLMISSDSNANRMLLAVLDAPAWREDMPRLVRGALGRQQYGHWNTTVANAWGVLAMEKFSAAFESTAVSGYSTINYGPASQNVTWPQLKGTAEVDLPWQQGPAQLGITHTGTGKPWVMIRATAALPLDKPLSTGFKVVRTVTPVEQQVTGKWTRGDVARVKLELDAQSDMSWVVVDDPIPAGSSVLGSGLGGQSALLQRGERREGWAWLAFQERRFDAFRSYYRFVPKGHWSVEYTVRLNNPGTFLLPATRVEAMYAPEMLGELPNAAFIVEPKAP